MPLARPARDPEGGLAIGCLLVDAALAREHEVDRVEPRLEVDELHDDVDAGAHLERAEPVGDGEEAERRPARRAGAGDIADPPSDLRLEHVREPLEARLEVADLSDIGATRTLAALERALLQPSAAMLPINRPVRIVTKDGRAFTGRRLNEDTHTVQIIDDQERLRSLAKADLRAFEVRTESPMPSYATRLTAAERADVIGYLLTLKGVR